MSLFLDSKKVGDTIEIMGPLGSNEYLGCGEFKLGGGRTAKVGHVAMLAGGTGLTPMLQVVQAALLNKSDCTKFTLIYANKCENDILCKDLLDHAEKTSEGRFKVHYTLDYPPSGWAGKTGFITQDLLGIDLRLNKSTNGSRIQACPLRLTLVFAVWGPALEVA